MTTEEELNQALHDVRLSTRDNCEKLIPCKYEGWNFNSGNYLFTTDTK